MSDSVLEQALRRDDDTVTRHENIKVLNKNLENLVTVCERHPANVPALIQEYEGKIQQDIFLLTEIRKRLWEQRFEKQAYFTTFRQMKLLIQEGADMHNKLLEYRYDIRKSLTTQVSDDTRRFNSGRSSPLSMKLKKGAKLRGGLEITNGSGFEERGLVNKQMSWEEIWASISMRTGITEPEIFFQRLKNG
jgi:hypothetical protein